MTQLSLNPEVNLDALVDGVLLGYSGPWGLASNELVLLKMMKSHKGPAQALPLQTISVQVGMSPRDVKAAIKSLIEDFGIPIGASRGKPCGYFLIVTPDNLEQALRPLKHELESLARRVRKLAGRRCATEMLEQLRLDAEKTETPTQ